MTKVHLPMVFTKFSKPVPVQNLPDTSQRSGFRGLERAKVLRKCWQMSEAESPRYAERDEASRPTAPTEPLRPPDPIACRTPQDVSLCLRLGPAQRASPAAGRN